MYGLHKDTVSSLILTMLPPLSHEYKHIFKMPTEDTPAYKVRTRIMELTLQALKVNAGFLLPEVRGGQCSYVLLYDKVGNLRNYKVLFFFFNQ